MTDGNMPPWALAMEARLVALMSGNRSAIMERIDRLQESLEGRLEGEIVTGAQAVAATHQAKTTFESHMELVEMIASQQRSLRLLEARVARLEQGT